MKKIIVTLAIVTATLSATNYTKEDRIKDMQIMASAMQDIQNGFFYNNFDMIKVGTTKLTETIVKVEPPLEEVEEKDVMTRYVNNKVQISNSIKRRINKKTKVLLERFSQGDTIQAIHAFTKITKECMKCHTQLRNW